MTGTVVSDKMTKTVIVKVERTATHRLYKKIMRRSSRYLAHDDHLDAKLGDTVRIVETRPMSRLKRWCVAEIVQRGEVAEIAPREIDAEYLSRHREKEEPSAPKAAAVAEGSPADEGAQAALAGEAGAVEEPATGEQTEETPEEHS